MTRPKSTMGNAIARRMRSTLAIAIDFGVSSPSTMWSEVMRVKAIASATVCPTSSGSPMCCVAGRISTAIAGSPTQPRPSEASVMPSCVTDSEESR